MSWEDQEAYASLLKYVEEATGVAKVSGAGFLVHSVHVVQLVLDDLLLKLTISSTI
jgi:hypothetical protein